DEAVTNRTDGQRGMITTTTVQRAFFAALLLLVSVAFFWLIRGFLQPIFWAVALGIIAYPLHARLERRLARRPSLAAAVSLLVVGMIVILPLSGIIAAVTTEAAALVQRLNQQEIQLGEVTDDVRSALPVQLLPLIDRIPIESEEIEAWLGEAALTASRFV